MKVYTLNVQTRGPPLPLSQPVWTLQAKDGKVLPGKSDQ